MNVVLVFKGLTAGWNYMMTPAVEEAYDRPLGDLVVRVGGCRTLPEGLRG